MAGFEGGETLANVDGDAELPVDAVDPRVQTTDLGKHLALERDRLGPERVDPGREVRLDGVDLLIAAYQRRGATAVR